MPATIDPRTGKQRKGFACMDKARLRAIASQGGASVPRHKRSFSRSRELAVEAGRKGGSVSRGGGAKPAV